MQSVKLNARPTLARRAAVSSKVVCQAAPKKEVATALTAAALAAVVGFGNVQEAAADISGLTPCKDSKAFAKRKKNELKGLQKRLKLYEADSAPALALKATMERTNKRFDNYANSGLLCGTDGLPHLIADPGLAVKYGHAGDVFIPTFGFLYFAGLLGHAGRIYLHAIKGDKNQEIIINVPLAFSSFGKAFGWPMMVLGELKNGTLTEKEANITVSPR